MSQVPWTRIREFKEEQERKKKREFEAALRQAQYQAPGQQQQQQELGPGQQALAQETKPFVDRFKEAYFKERLLFGGVVGAVTGAFFGGCKFWGFGGRGRLDQWEKGMVRRIVRQFVGTVCYRWSAIEGVVVIVLLFFILSFFVFGHPPPTDPPTHRHTTPHRSGRSPRHQKGRSLWGDAQHAARQGYV